MEMAFVRVGVCEGRKDKKKSLHCFEQIVGARKKGKVHEHVGPVGLYAPADRYSFNYAGFKVSTPEMYERY